MKSKRHNKIVKDYDKQKSKHLEKIATKLIKDKDKNDLLKEKHININTILNII